MTIEPQPLSLKKLLKNAFQRLITFTGSLARRLPARPRDPLPGDAATGGDFQAEYIKGALKKIDAGRPHASLGSNISEESQRKALSCFQHLLDQGISASDTVVDYGCGTLRIGKHLIQYLDADKYVGMDIDRRILDAGLGLLPRDEVEKKRPRLEVIDDDSIERVAQLRPSLVFAQGVLQHIPPPQLHHFFSCLARLGAHGTIVVAIKVASQSKKLSNRSWSYTASDILAAAGEAKLELVAVEGVWHHFRMQPQPSAPNIPGLSGESRPSLKVATAKLD